MNVRNLNKVGTSFGTSGGRKAGGGLDLTGGGELQALASGVMGAVSGLFGGQLLGQNANSLVSGAPNFGINGLTPSPASSGQDFLGAAIHKLSKLITKLEKDAMKQAAAAPTDSGAAPTAAGGGGAAAPASSGAPTTGSAGGSTGAGSEATSTGKVGSATGKLVSRPGGQIDASIAKSFDSMVAAAKKDGVSLEINSGFRSHEEQEKLYAAYQNGTGNLAAKPGTSNHESGLAIDFKGNPGAYDWLAKNAEKYGLKNLPSEPWHYSPTGT